MSRNVYLLNIMLFIFLTKKSIYFTPFDTFTLPNQDWKQNNAKSYFNPRQTVNLNLLFENFV